jgi:PIN domain nuclease of toxin-antitoxin system
VNVQLLLDTNAAILAVEGTLTPAAASLLSQRFRDGETVLLSPITGWELGLLFSRGRLRAAIRPREYLRRLTSMRGVAMASLGAEILLDSSFLPGKPPRDPADRIIAATAREHGYTVMTRDAGLLAYASEGYLSAVDC